jgi:hypothetical protein
VTRRDPRRASVEIETLRIIDALAGPTHLLDAVAATQGPHPPADAVVRFEHSDRIPGLAKFIRRHQPGNPRAEDHDRLAVPRPGRKREILRMRRGDMEQPQRFHAEVDRARAAHRAQSLQQVAPR